ncbi:hypothetical protein [Gemmatimonas sp.]|uniref:hypothetical protein n=1 Tax=Gemmatimonas sp. TaxID=1962908 RepID=UPI0035699010
MSLKVQTKGIGWYPTDVNGVMFGRISEASLAAQGLWHKLLCLACAAGEIVSVPSRITYLESHIRQPADVLKPLLAELCKIGSLSLEGDVYVIYGADRIHESLLTQRAGNRSRQAAKRDRDRASLPVASDVVELVTPAPVVVKPLTPMQEAHGAFIEECEDSDGTIAGYLAVIDLIPGAVASATAAGVASKDMAGFLRNAVIAHAAGYWCDTMIVGAELTGLFRLAKQTGPGPVLWALNDVASKPDLEPGVPALKYITKVAKSRASGASS